MFPCSTQLPARTRTQDSGLSTGRDGDSVAERHRKRFSEKGLDESLLKSAKLTFLEADSAAENLGLDDATYAEVCSVVGFY